MVTISSYAGVRQFNALPVKLKEMEDKKFKREMRLWFGKKALYTIDGCLDNVEDHEQVITELCFSLLLYDACSDFKVHE